MVYSCSAFSCVCWWLIEPPPSNIWFAISGSSSEKPNNWILIQFSFFENMLKMFANSRFCLAKEGNHLLLSYPDSLVLKNNINNCFTFFRLIDNNLSFGIFCKILCFHKKNLIAPAKVLLFSELCKYNQRFLDKSRKTIDKKICTLDAEFCKFHAK